LSLCLKHSNYRVATLGINKEAARRFSASWWGVAAMLGSALALGACGGGGNEAAAPVAAAAPVIPANSDADANAVASDQDTDPGAANAATDATEHAMAVGLETDTSTTPDAAAAAATRPVAGVLFYANYGQKTDPLVLANPTITGGFYMIYWSEIEKTHGQFDWAQLDAHIAEWKAVGKGIALRIVWSSSGYWAHPMAKTPTPQWVLDAGARYAYHPDSGTQVPLFWDPVYLKYAHEFLGAIGTRYDANTGMMFIDATPAAETNPYRFGTIDKKDPTFRDVFLTTAASDGTKYSASSWWTMLQTYIGSVKSHFPTLPVLVTLNKAGMPGEPSRLQEAGDLATSKKLWVGQNGLKGNSYTGTGADPWLTWGATTQVFFEPASAAGGTTGTMQQIVDACQRAGCNWLNVYYSDVFKATPGSSTYSASWDTALDDLALTVAK